MHFFTILSLFAAPIAANAATEQCQFKPNTFTCEKGYVATSCIAGGHHGVTGCYCCPSKIASQLEESLTPTTTNTKIVIDGTCSITRASGTTLFPVHSEIGEKLALGFAGDSGARHRLEIANNSGTDFAATNLIQLAVDRDEYLKNPPQLCPTKPEVLGLKCERENNALYPPYSRFAAIDNTDGIAIPVGYPTVYRKSLKPSELQEGGTVDFEATKTLDKVEARCKLSVSRQ